MNIFSHQNLETKTHCFSLLVMCPARKNLPSCPLYKIRQQNFSERVTWLKHLSTAEMEKISRHHAECYHTVKN